MLHLSLLPALFAPTFTPILAPTVEAAPCAILCAAELSRALPNEAIGVLLVGELDAQLFGDDAGQWARFLRDERWLEVFTSLAAVEGEVEGEGEGSEPEEVLQALDLAHSLLRGLRGGAFAAVDARADIRGVMRVDEGWFERVRARVGEVGGDLQETTCLGRPAVTGAAKDQGGTFLLVHEGSHAFLAIQPDVAQATETIGALIATLAAAGEDSSERWWLGSAARVADASIELFVDIAAVEPDESLAEMTAALGAPGVFYSAIVLGAGRVADMQMSVDFGGGPVMEAIANSLVPADAALFSYVPDGYTGTIIGLDVLGAIEEGLAFAEESTPGASTDYDQGLEALAGMLGVDVEEDLLAHLTGQILMLQPEMDFASIAELGEESAALEAMLPVFGLGIDDVDAVVGVIEALFEAASAQGLEAETAEIAGGSLWTFDPGMGMTIAVAAGSGFLAIGAEQGVVDLLARAAMPSTERAFEKDLAALASQLDGSILSVASIASAIESLASLQEGLEVFSDDDEEDAVMAELLTEIAAIAGEHLSGAMGGELLFTSKRVSYRMVSR